MNRGTFSGFKPEFPNRFISAPQALPAINTPVVVAHGLGAVPELVFAALINIIAEQNYQIGDMIMVSNYDTGANTYTLSADARDVRFIYNGLPLINNKTTGGRAGIALANWKLVFTAWL